METAQYKIRFERNTYGGESVGHLPDGRSVFTPFVLPGETAIVTPYLEKKRYVKAALNLIEEKLDVRIPARCPYFGICGGCQYQHIPYSEQLLVKKEIVINQLQRIGGVENPLVQPIIASDEEFYYRNSIKFQVNEKGELGFYHYFKSEIIPVNECHLPGADILALWKLMDVETFPGLRAVHFREGMNNELMVIFECEDFQSLPSMELDLPVSVVHGSPGGTIVMAGDDYLFHEIKQKQFKVSAGSFFQINNLQAEKMVDLVLNLLPASGESLLELYSGVGLFTAFCASRFTEVIAIEESESACEDFAFNLDEFDNISLYVGRVGDILPGIERSFDVVLLDPPRAGLDIYSFDALMALKAGTILYVSCDVATFARDVKKMVANGYQLRQVTPVDMFPQTYHVECIGLLELI